MYVSFLKVLYCMLLDTIQNNCSRGTSIQYCGVFPWGEALWCLPDMLTLTVHKHYIKKGPNMTADPVLTEINKYIAALLNVETWQTGNLFFPVETSLTSGVIPNSMIRFMNNLIFISYCLQLSYICLNHHLNKIHTQSKMYISQITYQNSFFVQSVDNILVLLVAKLGSALLFS